MSAVAVVTRSQTKEIGFCMGLCAFVRWTYPQSLAKTRPARLRHGRGLISFTGLSAGQPAEGRTIRVPC